MRQVVRTGISLVARCAAGAVLLLPAALPAHAELPLEQIGIAHLPAADAHRIYVVDPSLPHLVDSRLQVLDGTTMRVLGVLGTGFVGLVARSPDGRQLYVATTYYSRLQRGTRTDVLEVYDAATLTYQYEIELPPRHAQALPVKPLMAVTADGRYALVQNATPATSVTVVDLRAKRVAGEIDAPGCWGIIPWPQQPRRYSSLCGDGTLATVELAEDGSTAKLSASAPFFDPDGDPLFLHFETAGKQLFFVSYQGKVHAVSLEEDGPHFSQPWSLLSAGEAKAHWRPGGYELFSIDEQAHRLYIGMHDHGHDGSHKDPSRQVWVFDLATHKHLASGAGHGAISLALEKGPQPHLYLLDGERNEVLAFDPAGDPALKKPLARFEKAGDTPIAVRTQ